MNINQDTEIQGQVYFISLGCPKNQVDSEIMVAKLLMNHYAITEFPEEADYCIINTCGFIKDAVDESIENIKAIQKIKARKNSRLKKVIVVGCLVERFGFREMRKMIRGVDTFIDVNSPEKIISALQEIHEEITTDSLYLMNHETPRVIFNYPHLAYLKISEGCSNNCTFCNIPGIRGSYRSREPESILQEFRNMEQMGIKEIIIISQDSLDYGHDLKNGYDLKELLTEIDKINNHVPWVRVLYLNPDRLDDSIIKLINHSKSIVPYFELPIQHVAGNVLRRMGRRISPDKTKELFTQIKTQNQEAGIRTTFIVGFPGETDDDFQMLKDFIKIMDIDRIGLFKYSDEPDVPSFKLPDKVPQEIIDSRYQTLVDLCEEKLKIKNSELIGKTLEVMIDNRYHQEYLCRTKKDAPQIDLEVFLTSKEVYEPGEIVTVKVTDADAYSLYADNLGKD